MKFKVGDKIKIREDLVTDYNYLKHDDLCVTPKMSKYLGEIATIIYVDYSDNTVLLGENGYFWSFDMIQEIEQNGDE